MRMLNFAKRNFKELIRDPLSLILEIGLPLFLLFIFQQFNLGEVLNKKAKTLSGGWQRKLSIALALVSKPKVLFLDEPTLGLDVISRRELWKTIKSLKGQMTIILTTHYMEEAESLSDRIGIMANGNLVDVGTSSELIKKTNSKSFEDAFVFLATGGEV